MRKIALLIICSLTVSSVHAISFPGRSNQKSHAAESAAATQSPAAQDKASLPKEQALIQGPQMIAPTPEEGVEAPQSNTIPINLLELQFDHCVEENVALGSRLVGSYCQCMATEYYQNLPHLGYLRFLDGLAAKEKDALKYEKQTSEFCFAAVAKMVGPKN